jgi:hypothetical protein
MVQSRNSETWKMNVIGGETSPKLQSSIFESWYQPGSDMNKQDFMECIKTTHATYIIHGNAFKADGYTGIELQNARFAHARMGYNYIVTKIGAISTSRRSITVDVNIKQIGVAPFYYPLTLVLSCPGTRVVVNDLEKSLASTNEEDNFRFGNFPIDGSCLKNMKLELVSTFTYDERPIRFAQGNGTMVFSLPLPELAPSALAVPTQPFPVSAPVRLPPIQVPVRVPQFPVSAPVLLKPVPTPTKPLPDTVLTLIDADQGSKLREISNDMTINLAENQRISILAESSPSFMNGSVEFSVDGVVVRTENSLPFLIAGDNLYGIGVWRPTLGYHTIKVMPFTEKYRNGVAGIPTLAKILVVNQESAPIRAPIPVSPTRSPVMSPNLSLVLIDANRDVAISGMTKGMIIPLSKYVTLNIRADVNTSMQSVDRLEFWLDGNRMRIERTAPYTFYGNDGADFFGWNPSLGEHVVEVRAYRDSSAQSQFAFVTMNFFIVK